MGKIKVELVILGYLTYLVDFKKIIKWRSDELEITGPEYYEFLPDTDSSEWGYSDEQIEGILPPNDQVDITIGFVNAVLEDDYYARRLPDNRVVISLFEIGKILRQVDIPIENFMLRMVYEYVVVFKKLKEIPTMEYSITHDETRGCLFDLNPYKTDIIYSTEKVGLCEECKTSLKQSRVPSNFIKNIEKELKKLRKGTYYIIADFIKSNPIWSIVISLVVALIVNLLSSIIYDLLFS